MSSFGGNDLFRSNEEFRVHFLIEQRAASLREFVEAEFESLRRSMGQHFRWLSHHNRRSYERNIG